MLEARVDRVGEGAPPPHPRLDVEHPEPGFGEEGSHSLGGVAHADVAGVDLPGVLVGEAMNGAVASEPTVPRDVHEHRASGSQRIEEIPGRPEVVVDVLEHVERRDQVERLRLDVREVRDPEVHAVGVAGRARRQTGGNRILVDVDCGDLRVGVSIGEPVDERRVLGSRIEDRGRTTEALHDPGQPSELQPLPHIGFPDRPPHGLLGVLLHISPIEHGASRYLPVAAVRMADWPSK